MKKLIITLLILLTAGALSAQRWKTGFFAGTGLARMTVGESELSDELTVNPGKMMLTGTLGLQGYVTGSRDYPSNWLQIEKAFLFELSLCRCGGNIDVINTLPNGSRTIDQLEYVQYQLNVSPKAYLGLNQLKFFAGPNVSANLYSGVNILKDNEHRSAKAQIEPIAIGYELGSGIEFGKFLFAARYRGYFTSYGRETAVIPTTFGNYSVIFTLSFFFSESNLEKNRGSIFWDKY